MLTPIAATVHHLGPVGSGHTAKVLNNFLNAVTLAATAEVMVAGQRAGLDLRTLLAAVNGGSGADFATPATGSASIVEGDYLKGGLTSRLMAKDMSLYPSCSGGSAWPASTRRGRSRASGSPRTSATAT